MSRMFFEVDCSDVPADRQRDGKERLKYGVATIELHRCVRAQCQPHIPRSKDDLVNLTESEKHEVEAPPFGS